MFQTLMEFSRAIRQLPVVLADLRRTMDDVAKAKEIHAGLENVNRLRTDLKEEIRRTKVLGDHYQQRIDRINNIESVELWKRIKPITMHPKTDFQKLSQ